MNRNYFLTIDDAAAKLASESGKKFTELFRHGSMQVEYFRPFPQDDQQPHKQDEIYIVTKGYSEFIRNKEVITCKEGDFLFVPAGMEHRFINMSEDFSTWVIFYGPEGGEQNS